MTQLHFIAHTHWDREWYLPFQEFRLKLVHLVDQLLTILRSQPGFAAFTLDGQAVVLEDYLQIRPDRFEEIQALVRQGRLLIGPWYVLPDEFLVSPEALIRNLLIGAEACDRFGGRMLVGYLPDPFGHIAQMPQILRGFGIRFSAFRRGLGEDPVELYWQAPDGSRVLVSYLRDGYDNAARAPVEPQAFQSFVLRLRDSLGPHSACSHLLLMNGTDHHEAQPEIPSLVSAFRSEGDHLSISTLPAYFEALAVEIEQRALDLPVVTGDLRDCTRHHLLPGVLSSRTWIKQRNHACEVLLERWAEPFSSLSETLLGEPAPVSIWTGHLATPRLSHPPAVLRAAWRLLLTCQPHDSICGCSIDQVHHEMRTRFDQAEQIAEEITRQSLQDLADAVDTGKLTIPGARGAVVVFNPHHFDHTDWVHAELELPAGLDPFELLDEDGSLVPYQLLRRSGRSLTEMDLDGDGLRAMLAFVQGGEVMGLAVQEVAVIEGPERITIEVTLAEEIPPNRPAVEEGMRRVLSVLETHREHSFRLIARFATQVEIEFIAHEVPGLGFRSFALAPARKLQEPADWSQRESIENESIKVTIEEDGSLTLVDKLTGEAYGSLLRFTNVGERGDSYTHSPVGDPEKKLQPVLVGTPRGRTIPGGEELEYLVAFEIPAGLTPDRQARSEELVQLPVSLNLRLAAGIPRVDVHLSLSNPARDHRLQVLFPSGVSHHTASYGAAFEISAHPTSVPESDRDWVEDPAVERPMRDFVLSGQAGRGLLIGSRGLREASVSPAGVIAITLLRSFGWLSRDDLTNRKGGAGPQLETPAGQQIGDHDFDLCLIPFSGSSSSAIRQAHAFQTRLRGHGTGLHPGQLPIRSRLIHPGPEAFFMTACKSTADGRLLIRGVNLSEQDITLDLDLGFDVRQAWVARLDETELGELGLQGSRTVSVQCRPKEIKTLLFKV